MDKIQYEGFEDSDAEHLRISSKSHHVRLYVSYGGKETAFRSVP